jgi:TolB-like protein
VPAGLERLVHRLLEKDPALRYQSAADLRAGLERFRNDGKPAEPLRDEQASIVVLPFDNLSPDPDNAFFADGLTEEIIADLSKIRALRVISRTSAMMYKGAKKSLPAIARELNVRYVLEGSVRRAGTSLRITAQLIDARADAHLWAEKYSGPLDDVFEVQERLSRSIVTALELKLDNRDATRLAERPIQNVAAYECYLKARHEIWLMTPDSYGRALGQAREGLRILGENELLYWVMGHVYAMQGLFGAVPRADAQPLLSDCATRILALNPDSPKGHALLGMMEYWQGKRVEAARSFRKSLEEEANDPDVLGWLISIYGRAGKTAPAHGLLDHLLAIDPLTPFNRTWIGWFDLVERNLPEHLLAAGRAHVEAEPDSQYAHWVTLWGLVFTQRIAEAEPVADRMILTGPETGFGRWAAMMKHAVAGRRALALGAVTPELLSWARGDDIGSHAMACGYALLGMLDEVLHWLENAIATGSTNYPHVANNPYMTRVLRGPRAEELLHRLHLMWQTQAL